MMKPIAKWQVVAGLILLSFLGLVFFITFFASRNDQPRENRSSSLDVEGYHKTERNRSGAGPGSREFSYPEKSADSQGLISVSDFVDRFDAIDSSLSGVELRESRSKLIGLAAEKLTLEELVTLADSIRDKVYHTDLSGYLAVRFAHENPKLGMKWLIEQSNFEDSSSAALTFGQLCKFDAFPLDDLTRFGSDKKKSLLIEGMMKNAPYEVTRDALQYLNEHPNVSQQNGNLVPELFDSRLQNGNFRESLDLYKKLDDPSLKVQILCKVFEHASSDNPELAKELLNEISNEERSMAIKSIAGSWGLSEPDKVAGWINTLSNIKQQDAAKEGLVSILSHSDPHSSLEWARSISDEDHRLAVVAKLASQFKISNPELVKKIQELGDP